VTGRLALPTRFPPISSGLVLLACFAYAAAVGSLAFPVVLAVGFGVPLGILALVSPRWTLALLIISIPFSTWTQAPIGAFDVTATDVLVGVLIGGWIVRGVLRRELVIRGGPIGLAFAISAKRRGIDPLVIGAGELVNLIVHYPVNMTLFTTS